MSRSAILDRVNVVIFSLLVVFLGLVLLSISARAVDNFPGTTISGSSGSVSGTTIGMGAETNEPATIGGLPTTSEWFSWTAPSTGTAIFGTCNPTTNSNTQTDTVLAVYVGNAVGSLGTAVVSDDDGCVSTVNANYSSIASFAATAGTIYRIQIDTYGGSAQGTFQLKWSYANQASNVVRTIVGSTATEGGTNGSFTLALNTMPSGTATVTLGTSPNCTFSPSTLNFGIASGTNNWDTAQTVTVTATNNAVVDGTRSCSPATMIINGGGYSNLALTPPSFTVYDNDALVTIANGAAGNETGPASATFTVTQSGVSGTATIVAYSVSGAATAGSDFTAPTGTVTIPAGSTTATITIPILNDAVVEGTEGLTVTLTSITSGLGTLGATLVANNTIADNDSATVSIASITGAAEPVTAGTLRLTLTKASATTTTVSYTVAGSATSGTDYTSIGTSVLVPANTLTFDIAVAPIDDVIVEGSENVIVTLTSATSNALITASGNATNTIADDDVSTVSIASISNAAEPATSGTLRLTLTKASATATTVSYTVTGTATSGTDYTSTGTSVVVPANTLTFDISVAPLNDLIVEGSETVITTLTAATSNGLITASGNTTNTIADDDVATLTLGVPAVNEATGTATFAVTLNVATATGFTIAAATSSGTATQGTDFTAATPTLTFVGTAGESQNISVPITDDALVEGSEAFNITLSALSNSFGGALTFTSGAQSRTIADNDVSTVSIASITNAAEPVTSGTLRLTLTKASATTTTVFYTVAGTATDGTDYTSIGTSVVVPANTLTFDISIVPTDDFIVESAETLIVTLTSATSNVLITASGNATNTIADNDVASLVLGAPAINEAAGTAVYPVTLSAATSSGFTIAAATSSGTATQGTDFTAATPTLTFAGNASEVQTISVPITEDVLVEGSEAFNITLSALSNSFGGALTFTSGAQSRTIADNDVSTVSIASITNAAEPATSGTLRLTLTKASATSTTVSYTVAGTATAGTDYTSIGTSVVVPANALTFDIDVAPLNDIIVEGSETVITTLTAATSNVLVTASGNATNTIADDESATVSISNTSNGAEAVVPTNGVMTVTQTAVSATDTVLTYTFAGTATAGSDYTALSGNVTILAGATSATITIPVLDNLVVEPSETVIITLSSATNNALITALGNATNTIADNDVASFTISKAVNLSNIAAPVSLNYTITVSNTGNVPLTAPVLTDALSNGASLTLTSGPTLTSGDVVPLGSLDSGETWIYSASYTVTQANINSGSTIANTATFDAAETSASTSNTVTTTITQNPHLKITKNVNTNGPVPVGTILTYTYEIENDGNLTMTNVSVNDTHNGFVPLVGPSNEVLTDVAPATDSTDSSQSGPADGVWDTLAPGDIVTFSATYEVQQHDVDYLQ